MPQEAEIVVKFTPNEAQVSLQLYDLATKAGGNEVARASLHLTDKINAAAQAAGQDVQEDAEAPPNGEAPKPPKRTRHKQSTYRKPSKQKA